MFRGRFAAIACLLLTLSAVVGSGPCVAGAPDPATQPTPPRSRLDLTLEPRFGGKPLAFDTLALETAASQSLSITRLDLLLSSAALRRPDGTWITARDWSAYVSIREARTSFAINRIPAGKFTRIRFTVGLPPEINKGDPARYPAGHALNPVVNGMHWGWQGGYVFMAVEGLWRDPDGKLSGYSWHLANDGNTANIEFPLDLDLTRDQSVRLALDARALFGTSTATAPITAKTATTHSRSGDPLVPLLLDRLPSAFSVVSLQATPARADLTNSRRALIAPGATPYPFTIPKSFPWANGFSTTPPSAATRPSPAPPATSPEMPSPTTAASASVRMATVAAASPCRSSTSPGNPPSSGTAAPPPSATRSSTQSATTRK